MCSLAQTVFLKNSKRLQEDNGGKNYFTCQKIFFLNGFLLFNRLYVRKYMNEFSFYWLPYIPTAPCNNVQQMQGD